jgi:spore coat protein A
MAVTISRRTVVIRSLGATAASLVGGRSAHGASWHSPQPRIVTSDVSLPGQFIVDLPVPSFLKPISVDREADRYTVDVRTSRLEILPGFQTTVWGYEGLFPGPTFETRAGQPISLTLRNKLPVPIAHHLHGAHASPESDGYPTDLILPAGFNGQIHADKRAVTSQVSRVYRYPNDQRSAMLWYHDHRMDFTGPQVWRGLAGMYLIRDDEELNSPLPLGEFELPLLICDRSFEGDGNFKYPSLDPELKERMGVEHSFMGGVLGDVVLVNGAPWPRFAAAQTLYRLRLLNASNARWYELQFETNGHRLPFTQIGTDGGLLRSPVRKDSILLTPGERADIVVDFSMLSLGSTATLTNLRAHGRMSQVMRFDISRQSKPSGAVPTFLSDVRPLERSGVSRVRDFHFSYGLRDGWLINDRPFDPERTDADPTFGSTELWRISSDAEHPVHLHGVHFQVANSGWHERHQAEVSWKDTVALSAHQRVELLIPFTAPRGRYVFHCHNLEHEDMAMMANFEVI